MLHGTGRPPPADQRTIFRRINVDLAGLPPTVDEMQEFLNDDSPGTIAKAVDPSRAS